MAEVVENLSEFKSHCQKKSTTIKKIILLCTKLEPNLVMEHEQLRATMSKTIVLQCYTQKTDPKFVLSLKEQASCS
jgi:hypothetical protein